jgi:hypothetical protein
VPKASARRSPSRCLRRSRSPCGGFDEALHGLVDVEIRGHRGDAAADLLQSLTIGDAGLAAARSSSSAGAAKPAQRHRASRPCWACRPGRPRIRRRGWREVGLHLVDLAFGHDALADQRSNRARASSAGRIAIHQRLGERRLVAFVVAEAAIAEHVDDDVFAELLAEFGGDLGGVDHRFRIVAVHVEDRRLDHLGHVGRIGRRAREARRRGEADLVVDDEVDRAAGAVALEARERRSTRRPRPGRRRPRRRGSAAA